MAKPTPNNIVSIIMVKIAMPNINLLIYLFKC